MALIKFDLLLGNYIILNYYNNNMLTVGLKTL